MTDDLLKVTSADKSFNRLIRKATDAIALMGHIHSELSQQRKFQLKPALSFEYKRLCNQGTPVTNLLFGDNISKAMADAKQVSSLAKKAVPTTSKNGGGRSWENRGNGQNNYNKKVPERQQQLQERQIPEEKRKQPQQVDFTTTAVSDSLTWKNQLLNINVKNYKEKLTNIAAHEKQCFQGGKLKQFMSEWMSLTSDKEILNAINGYEIKLTDIPWQMKKPKLITFTVKEENVISKEIAELLRKGVIEKTENESNDFVSKIFVREEKHGSAYRMILDLSKLNDVVQYRHFKMDTLKSAINMMTPNC